MDTMVERININNFSMKLKPIQSDRSSTTENKANLFKIALQFLVHHRCYFFLMIRRFVATLYCAILLA